MIGQEFGAFVVESQAGSGTRGVSWWCRCTLCEKVVKRTTYMLTHDGLKSCGCTITYHPNVVHPSRELKQAHRLTFVSWKAMMARCYYAKKKQKCYEGIGVCERWFDFRNFLEDMGDRPSFDHSIDRITPTCGYSKKNCQWLLKGENFGKTRPNRDPEVRRRKIETRAARKAAGMYGPLREESRRKIGAGALKRIGRKLQQCTKCSSRSYMPICQRCTKEAERASSR